MESVKEGQYVALMRAFDPGNMKIVSALDDLIHYGKLHFNTKALIDSKIGSVFMIEDKEMVEIENFADYNSELSRIVSNNMINFEGKSQFSQEKMIRKKKKSNFANIVHVMKPTLLMINEMLYSRNKVGGLRPDLLALLMTSANIRNGSKCLLLDHNLGLVTGAIASRILPDGICIQLIYDPAMTDTTRKTLAMLNITQEHYKNKLLAIHMMDFYNIHQGKFDLAHEVQILKDRSKDLESKSAKRIKISGDYSTNDKCIDDDRKSRDESFQKRELRRDLRNQERFMAVRYLVPNTLDSIVLIAQNDHPLEVLKLSYKFLAPSGQIVIYSDVEDPLLECYQYLKTNSMAILLTLSRPFLRKYQMLPDRSRPEMNTTGYGGYLLSGTKTIVSDD